MFLANFCCLLRFPPFCILFFVIFISLCITIEDLPKISNINGGVKWVNYISNGDAEQIYTCIRGVGGHILGAMARIY